MIRFDCEQGGPEWTALRLGIPTASCFDQILTSKKLEYSASAVKYRNKLLAEYILGYSADDHGNDWTERGQVREAAARARYEFEHDVEVELVGFIMRDDRKVGGSPDGLVGADGILELKVPAIHTHIGYMLDPQTLEDQYRHQCQGGLYLTGRKWADLVSDNPELPPVTRRIERDERYISALDAALKQFVADLDSCKAFLAQYRTPFALARAA